MQVDLQKLIIWVLGIGVALLLLTFVPYLLVVLLIGGGILYFYWKQNKK